ncbi:hypothetical protein AVEN_92894-1 [Araneus ventricosus]|uniref:Uncharacterized protein n=1 Tax=Araneus ventricosus TaxID=182803 RepID=A0A4Y2D039_ARAVE|nr:hypothetical protein AVEN_92894-1 [Araneus ventricosus]
MNEPERSVWPSQSKIRGLKQKRKRHVNSVLNKLRRCLTEPSPARKTERGRQQSSQVKFDCLHHLEGNGKRTEDNCLAQTRFTDL